MLHRASCSRLIPRVCSSYLTPPKSQKLFYRHSSSFRTTPGRSQHAYIKFAHHPAVAAHTSQRSSLLSSSLGFGVPFTFALPATSRLGQRQPISSSSTIHMTNPSMEDTTAQGDQTTAQKKTGRTRQAAAAATGKTTKRKPAGKKKEEEAALDSCPPVVDGKENLERGEGVDAVVTEAKTPEKGVKRGRGGNGTPSSRKKTGAKAAVEDDTADDGAAEAGDDNADAPQKTNSRKRVKKTEEPTATKTKTTTKRTKATAAVVAETANGTVVEAIETTVVEEVTTKKTASKSGGRKKKEVVPPPPVYSYDMRPPPLEGPAFRILSWNVAGIRALVKKAPTALTDLVKSEEADVLCLQEVKAGDDVDKTVLAEQLGLADWHWHWCCGDTKGYSGVAIASRSEPISVWSDIGIPEHDKEGRVVTAEFEDMFVVNVYVPNSGDGLKRLDYRVNSWDKEFSSYLKGLEAKGKPVVLTGDMNCAHKEIDIHSPKTNLRSAGFTQEERDSFEACYINQGFVDTWREQYPGVTGYTYWTYKFNCRAKNKGWRLDYYLVSSSLQERVYDSYIKYDIMGSDHCPLGLILKK